MENSKYRKKSWKILKTEEKHENFLGTNKKKFMHYKLKMWFRLSKQVFET